jgi:hypothetical protein
MSKLAAEVQVTDFYVRRRDRRSLNPVEVVGPMPPIEVADVPATEGPAPLAGLTRAGVPASLIEYPIADDSSIVRARLLLRASDETAADAALSQMQ